MNVTLQIKIDSSVPNLLFMGKVFIELLSENMHEYAEITSRRHAYTDKMLCNLFFSIKDHKTGSIF